MIGTNKFKWHCSLPWNGFSNDPDGKVRPCCLYKDHIKQDNGEPFYVQTHTVKEIFSSLYMKNLRQQFRNGEKPVGCQTCIKDEENNYTSKRLSYLDGNLGRNTDFESEPEYPIEYQMIISNACNLKCRSCTPSHSSQWQAEHKVVWGWTGYKMDHGQPSDSKSVLWEDRKSWMSKVKRLEIVGGEPFYIKKWETIWQELIDSGLSKDINMDMSSNATIYAGDTIKKLSKNFKSLGVGLSIDGTGAMYNYLRHPGNWEEVKDNIIRYHDIQDVGFSISHTIGWLNAYSLPDFHSWCKEHVPRFRIWNNIIHWPRHMSIVMIPKEVKDLIEEKWSSYDWGKYKNDISGILNFMRSENPTDTEIKQAYKEFLRYDAVRNENVLSVIPSDYYHKIQKYFE